MMDYTLYLTDFLIIANRYLSEEQQTLLHTISEISADFNYAMKLLPLSEYTTKTSFHTAYKAIKRIIGDEDHSVMVLAKAVMKDNTEKLSVTDMENVARLTHLMIEKIREKPYDYLGMYKYAEYLSRGIE
jgi:hypothetical protein